jgi:hypothetical protein
MNVIVGGRQSGKTSKLLQWASEQPEGTGRVIISHSLRASMDLLRRARDAGYNVESWQFVSVSEVRDKGIGFMAGVRINRRHIEFGLDNLDLVLTDLIGAPLTTVTMTAKAEVLPDFADARTAERE